jgi:hypothetical protein
MVTCPLESESDSDTIKWEKNDVELQNENEKQVVLRSFSETEDNGYYVCYDSNSKKNHYLYLKAKGNTGGSFQRDIPGNFPNPGLSSLLPALNPGSLVGHTSVFSGIQIKHTNMGLSK